MEYSDDSPIKVECRGSRARRKLIQSTLVPRTTPEKLSGGEHLNEGEEDEACRKQSPGSGSSSRKRRRKTDHKTPKRNGKLKAAFSEVMKDGYIKQLQECQTRNLSTQKEQVSQKALDLHLEAKIAAEENARLSGGRQIHPFFTTWKSAKNFQDVLEITDTDIDNYTLDEGPISFCPVHVFEKSENEFLLMDWKNWTFSESSLLNSVEFCDPDTIHSSACEGSVVPLQIDDCLSNSHCCHLFLLAEGLRNDQMHEQGESTPAAREQLAAFLKLVKQNDPCEFVGLAFGEEEQQQAHCLQERLVSYHIRCSSQPQGTLWTSKYQPESSLEVCGNNESVRSLSEWLQCWLGRASHFSEFSIEESRGSWFLDSDTDDLDEGPAYKNVFLVTGPVGSGKSAAIYACAKEQGFEIIEVNSSDCRNGTTVKQKFQEAMESHRFNKWPQGNQSFDSPTICSNQRVSKESRPELLVASVTRGDQSTDVMRWPEDNQEKEAPSKSLILFEEIDNIFEEDRGFTSTLLHLAQTTKRPIILTSNRKDPCLPHLLDRLTVDFAYPSTAELLYEICMVCTAEKVYISLQLVERFLQYCKNDMRKTIMLLQFWCQGTPVIEEKRRKCTYNPLLFDIDAAHLVIPKILPWDFPCQLSILVEKEISKALSLAKNQEGQCEGHGIDMGKNKMEDTVDGKEAMLRQNFSDVAPECLVHFDNVEEFLGDDSDSVVMSSQSERQIVNAVISSDSEEVSTPSHIQSDNHKNCSLLITPTPRKERRKLFIMHSSDSGGYHDPSITDILLKESCGDLLPEVTSRCTIQSQDSRATIDLFPNQTSDDMTPRQCEQNSLSSCGTDGKCHSQDAHFMYDISCVMESSFIPETVTGKEKQCVSRAESFANGEVSTRKSGCNLDEKEAESVKSSKKSKVNVSETRTDSCSHGEFPGYSVANEAEATACEYRVLDECSRMDFCTDLKVNVSQSLSEADLVQETWSKLRISDSLKPYVTSSQRTALHVLKLSYALTCLISEADVLLSHCQPLTRDHLDSPLGPCEELESACWCDNQMEFTSVFAQHGFCFFTKNSDHIGTDLGCDRQLDLAQEMLFYSSNSMALGKLIMFQIHERYPSVLRTQDLKSHFSMHREKEEVYNRIIPIIPVKLHLSVRGAIFHEYLSFLSHISRSDSIRLHEGASRRLRCNRHYLCTGELKLSSDDVHLLGKYSFFGEAKS